jgi:hypothetical protein
VVIVEQLKKLFFLSNNEGLWCANLSKNGTVEQESTLVVPGAFKSFS